MSLHQICVLHGSLARALFFNCSLCSYYFLWAHPTPAWLLRSISQPLVRVVSSHRRSVYLYGSKFSGCPYPVAYCHAFEAATAPCCLSSLLLLLFSLLQLRRELSLVVFITIVLLLQSQGDLLPIVIATQGLLLLSLLCCSSLLLLVLC